MAVHYCMPYCITQHFIVIMSFSAYFTHATNITNDIADLVLPFYLLVSLFIGIVYYKYPAEKKIAATATSYQFKRNLDWKMQLNGKWAHVERSNLQEVSLFFLVRTLF